MLGGGSRLSEQLRQGSTDRRQDEPLPMKNLFVAITLLTAFAASAQTAPTAAPNNTQIKSFSPPAGTATGSAPPAASAPTAAPAFRGDGRDRDRRGGTQVIVTREELEQRLARVEELLGQALERSRRWEGKGLLNDAYEQLSGIREMVENAPELRNGPGPSPMPPSRPPPPPPGPQPLSDGQMRNLLGTMSRESFARDKLNVLQSASGGDSFFVVEQVQQVLAQFQFSKDRLAAVRMLWPRVLDRQNGFQLNSAFQFSADKEELKRIITSG